MNIVYNLIAGLVIFFSIVLLLVVILIIIVLFIRMKRFKKSMDFTSTTTTGNSETNLHSTIGVSNNIEQSRPGTLSSGIEEIEMKENLENVGNNSNQAKQHRERYLFETEDNIMPSSSSTDVVPNEPKQVAIQTFKNQENVGVGDGFSNDHIVGTEAPPPSSTGTLATETEPLQEVKEEDNHKAEDGKVIPLSYNNMLSTETEHQMSSLSVKKNNENSFSQEEHKEDSLIRAEKAKNISPSSSSNTLTTEAKQVESQAVIGDSFNEQNVNKEDTGDYPTGEEETGKVPSSSSTGSLSTEANQIISQAVEESVNDNFSQKEMV